MTAAKFVSRYDQRVELVQKTLTKNSKLDKDAAHTLAVQILDALDRIPERIR